MDSKQLKEIFSIFENSQVAKMDLEINGMSLKLEKGKESNRTDVIHPQTSQGTETNQETFDSPLVGVYWQASQPNDQPYVQVGDTVKEGDIVCLIEAMKSMNEIRIHKSGVIEEILVNDGDLIEYGQPLFRLGESQ